MAELAKQTSQDKSGLGALMGGHQEGMYGSVEYDQPVSAFDVSMGGRV